MRISDWSSDVCSSDLQMAGGLDLDDPSLPPVTDIPSLQAAIRAFIDARAIPAGGWVVVWQYDNEALPEKRHITRAELDAVAANRKIDRKSTRLNSSH